MQASHVTFTILGMERGKGENNEMKDSIMKKE
jgi:hypothetical protein